VRFYPGSYEYNADPDHGQNPFSRSGSILTINARPSTDTTLTGGQTWVSGMLTTFGFFKQWYGLWEVRMRSVNSRGSLPAFWMLMGEQDAFPEIDIAEIGNGANADERLRSFWTAQHHTSSLDDTWAPTQRIFPALGSDTNIHQSFHTYSFYFDEQICVWYFDGKPVRQIPTPDKLRWAPYYLIISNSIGSDDPAWGLPPDGTTLNPTTLEIDWVRVWSIW